MAGVNPQLVIRIAANVEELKKNLAEGRANIEALGPSVAKMGATWQAHSATLIQNAHNITAAMKGIEAGTLTAADAAKNLKTLDAAMAHLAATGKEIPPAMRDTAESLRDVAPPTQSWSDKLLTVKSAFQGLIALKAVQWAKEGVTAALDYADSLSNLSVSTDVSMQGLQRLESIGVTSGVSMETLAKSVQMLHRNLDNPAAISAIGMMGLNYKQIRDLEPEQQFLEIAKSVAAIEDPVARANAGTALFGKTWDTISPAIQGDIQAIIDSTTLLTDATIKELDRAGDEWDTFWLNTKRKSIAAMVEIAHFLQPGGGFHEIVLTAPKAPGLLIGAGPTDLTISQAELGRVIRDSNKAIDDQVDAAKRLKAEHDKAAATLVTLRARVHEIEFGKMVTPADLTNIVAVHAEIEKAPPALQRLQWEIANTVNIAGKEIPILAGHFTDLPPKIGAVTQAIEGLKANFGSFGKIAQSIGTGFLEGIGSMLSGGISTLVSKGLGLAVSGIKKLFGFGGPSAEELAAHAAADQWTASLVSQFDRVATSSEILTAAGRDWAKVNIQLTKTYVDLGLTGEQALSDINTVTNASKHTALEVQVAIARINETMAAASAQKQANIDLTKGELAAELSKEAAITGASTARMDLLKGQLKGLADEHKKLTTAIEMEAPEEIMGTIETLMRGEAAALEKEMAKSSKALEAEWQGTGADMKAFFESLNIRIPIAFDIPALPDLYGGSAPFGTMPIPPGASASSAASSAFSGRASQRSGSAINIVVVSQLDGREVARNQIRHIPGALEDAGL